MRFPRPNEYNIILLGLIVWLATVLYTHSPPPLQFGIPAPPLQLMTPAFLLIPIVWAIAERKINRLVKVAIVCTSWFVFFALIMYLFAVFKVGVEVRITSTTAHYLIVLGTSALMLLSLRKPRLRWPCFWGSVAYYAAVSSWITPFQGWFFLKPIDFLLTDFLPFIFPLVLYVQMAGSSKSEREITEHIKRVEPLSKRIRGYRLAHLGTYALLIFCAVYFALDLLILRPFFPHVYLLKSAELASPAGWLLIWFLTGAMIVLLPLALLIAGGRIGSKIKR